MDKPAGPTSHDAVARVRRALGVKAVGHAGTLDPFATGLLVILAGPATRLARFVERERKTYLAEARLGVRTATDDPTGDVIPGDPPSEWPAREQVAGELARLVGPQRQVPPAYSAKKVGGERSYRLARRGAAVALEPVAITVFDADLVEYRPPLVRFRCTVSPGTYIRALARDLGEALGTGAHLAALRRERIGPFGVEDAVPLDRVTGAERLIPAERLVAGLPSVPLAEAEVGAVAHGRDVKREGETSGEAALLADGRLVAIGQAVPGGWHPAVVLPAADR